MQKAEDEEKLLEENEVNVPNYKVQIKVPSQQITNPKKSLSSILKYEITIAEQTGKRGHFLEMIYQMLLTVPPTSVDAERVFSSCAYLCNRFRSRLGGTTLNNLCFIRNNRS
ncbi:hypothetical protein LOD99_4041 [Oopsacas minuta]|uniref:HAT C-terminal dimerisation domain-containing protein n=1 Tax=Oopsacas minuta TaxID=111878 RepID=A0AAV7JVM0_9METZ|nr:hypothetical protein LOD99_4041 [Oopsacas minuta]